MNHLFDVLSYNTPKVVYVELNDAVPGFSMASCPELSRELPGHTGIIDSAGMLAAAAGALRLGAKQLSSPASLLEQFVTVPAALSVDQSHLRALRRAEVSGPANVRLEMLVVRIARGHCPARMPLVAGLLVALLVATARPVRRPNL